MGVRTEQLRGREYGDRRKKLGSKEGPCVYVRVASELKRKLMRRLATNVFKIDRLFGPTSESCFNNNYIAVVG